MAANDPVGNVDAMKILTTDSTGETYTDTVTSKKIFVNPNATYTQVNAQARALAALSFNSYDDTVLVTSISVNEVLAAE